MAFLVCYSSSAPKDHCRQKAIYLDQNFYELIFRHCMKTRSNYAVLSVVASLRYKSPMLVLDGDDLDRLVQELGYLEAEGQSHSQFDQLRHVCAKAKADGNCLSITGDMYPEL